MRLGSLLSEAWRNIAGGTARVALLALLAALGTGLLAAADAHAQADALARAQHYRQAGASVRMLQAPGAVDGDRCESLASVTGIPAAGALRRADPLTVLALPATPVTAFEASPGLLDVLAGPHPSRTAGVWLSGALATALGAGPGSVLATATGDTRVAGVFRYPSDGRDQLLSYAVVAPVSSAGRFDQCWAEAWPSAGTVQALLRLPLDPGTSGADKAAVAQLNPRLGESFDLAAALEGRPTRPLLWAALGLGLLLGAVSIRMRRLELASARHAGVRPLAQAGQLLVETAAWALPAVLLAAPLVLAGAWVGNPGSPLPVFVDALRLPLGAGGCALLGALAVVLLTRERHLFRYFKDR